MVLLVSKYLLVTANSPINIFACVSSRFSFLLTSFSSRFSCSSVFRFQLFFFITSEFLSAISQKFKQESKEIYFPQGRKHCVTYVCFLLFLYSTQKKVILFSLTRLTLFNFCLSWLPKCIFCTARIHVCNFVCCFENNSICTHYTQPEQKSVFFLQMMMCCICIDKVSVSDGRVCVRAISRTFSFFFKRAAGE